MTVPLNPETRRNATAAEQKTEHMCIVLHLCGGGATSHIFLCEADDIFLLCGRVMVAQEGFCPVEKERNKAGLC